VAPHAEAFRERYGPWALVTGAAQGIGLAFAEALARRGLSLHLLDVQAEAVSEAARALRACFDVEVRPLVVDLVATDFMDAIASATSRTEIGLVVCNAAVGRAGSFLDEIPEQMMRAVAVNCVAPLRMTHHFLREMVERKRGGILLVASGTALQGSPGYASYAATKAFDLVLAESLWHELHEQGVEVMAFVPGPTNTPGLRSTMPGLREGQTVGPIELPGTTAEAALAALGSGPAAAREPEHQAALEERRRATTRILARRRRIRR